MLPLLTTFASAEDADGYYVPEGDEIRSYWLLSGSVMALVGQEGEPWFNRIVYVQPRASLSGRGVKPGTVYFQGIKQGEEYLGMAFLFSKYCDPMPYQATVQFRGNSDRIMVIGLPSIRDRDCSEVGQKEPLVDVLEYLGIEPPNTP